mmetsp:Transcript_5245/g.14012  ORF Transcript_5245/g.14012 Transcript_5245/m.14012 type:complete len:287 (+) Transcript_5245:30-890(+)
MGGAAPASACARAARRPWMGAPDPDPRSDPHGKGVGAELAAAVRGGPRRAGRLAPLLLRVRGAEVAALVARPLVRAPGRRPSLSLPLEVRGQHSPVVALAPKAPQTILTRVLHLQLQRPGGAGRGRAAACGAAGRSGARGRGGRGRGRGDGDGRGLEHAPDVGREAGGALPRRDHLHEGPGPEGDLLLLLPEEERAEGLALVLQRRILHSEGVSFLLCPADALLALRPGAAELAPELRVLQREAANGHGRAEVVPAEPLELLRRQRLRLRRRAMRPRPPPLARACR